MHVIIEIFCDEIGTACDCICICICIYSGFVLVYDMSNFSSHDYQIVCFSIFGFYLTCLWLLIIMTCFFWLDPTRWQGARWLSGVHALFAIVVGFTFDSNDVGRRCHSVVRGRSRRHAVSRLDSRPRREGQYGGGRRVEELRRDEERTVVDGWRRREEREVLQLGTRLYYCEVLSGMNYDGLQVRREDYWLLCGRSNICF